MQVYAAPVCFIFDLVATNAFTRETVVSGFREVLESNSIIKVMHDCSKPAAAIFYQLHIRLCNVFDTQVAMGSCMTMLVDLGWHTVVILFIPTMRCMQISLSVQSLSNVFDVSSAGG